VIFGVGNVRAPHSMTQLLTDHAAAVRDFAVLAAAISADQWNVERAPGKWTPAELGTQVAQFEAAVMEMQRSQPRRRVTHPYFSVLTLSQLVRFCTVHTRHHTAFLWRNVHRS
jgi:hypothetical protein